MAKVKKIYKYVNQLVDRCKWCYGTGYNAYLNQVCGTCKGRGGKWVQVPVLVGEEVTQ